MQQTPSQGRVVYMPILHALLHTYTLGNRCEAREALLSNQEALLLRERVYSRIPVHVSTRQEAPCHLPMLIKVNKRTAIPA